MGWQVQPVGPTIQEIFQNILSEICHEKIILLGAGRTDSGVHALGQVAHFKTSHPIDLVTLQRALNARLPNDIAVLKLDEALLDFHSQKDAVSKTYTYLIFNSHHRSPFLEPYVWQIYGSLNLDAMHRCLERLVGEHDFGAFKAADSTAKTSIRRLEAVSVHRVSTAELGNGLIPLLGLQGMLPPLPSETSNLVAIHLKGRGFLKHMVRNIVGTVLWVGQGKMSEEEFQKIFESRDRRKAGMTAPAKGLFLVKVEY